MEGSPGDQERSRRAPPPGVWGGPSACGAPTCSPFFLPPAAPVLLHRSPAARREPTPMTYVLGRAHALTKAGSFSSVSTAARPRSRWERSQAGLRGWCSWSWARPLPKTPASYWASGAPRWPGRPRLLLTAWARRRGGVARGLGNAVRTEGKCLHRRGAARIPGREPGYVKRVTVQGFPEPS